MRSAGPRWHFSPSRHQISSPSATVSKDHDGHTSNPDAASSQPSSQVSSSTSIWGHIDARARVPPAFSGNAAGNHSEIGASEVAVAHTLPSEDSLSESSSRSRRSSGVYGLSEPRNEVEPYPVYLPAQYYSSLPGDTPRLAESISRERIPFSSPVSYKINTYVHICHKIYKYRTIQCVFNM